MSNIKELRRGDNDNNNIWGGDEIASEPVITVKQLQAGLQLAGVYDNKIDGDFGKNTERAVKIFQWCLKNSEKVINNKILTAYSAKADVKVSGVLDSSTYTILGNWLSNKYVVTGDLIRVSASDLSNIELGPGFKCIGKPIVNNDEFVLSKAAFTMVKLMNEIANDLNLIIKVNQALRLHGAKVTGSVVPPATKSQHLIGHAIDCNIVDGSSWNTSSDFEKKKQTANADTFIEKMKQGLYRWGGDFTRADTPHFDKQLDAGSFDYDAKFFLNQKQISSGESIDKQFII